MKISKLLVCMLLICSMLLLFTGCFRISRKYLKMKEQGLLPTNEDFPNSRWDCQELDMSFCMLEYGSYNFMGTYKINDTTYPLWGLFHQYGCDSMSFRAYTEQNALTLPDGLLNFQEETLFGFIGDYRYRDGKITLSNISYHEDIKLTPDFPETLTFVQNGNIAQQQYERWYAKEIDLYMDSFTDVENVYKGVLTMNGKPYKFDAFAYTMDGTYYFSFSDSIRLDFRMHIVPDKSNDTLIGTLGALSCTEFLEYYGQATITFTKEAPEPQS